LLLRLFGPKRDEVEREWTRLHNKGLTDLYYSPNIIRVMISRRIRWAWHVLLRGERGVVYRVWGGGHT